MIENAHLIHSKQCPVIFLLFNVKLKSVVTSVLLLNELLKAYVNEKAHGPIIPSPYEKLASNDQDLCLVHLP